MFFVFIFYNPYCPFAMERAKVQNYSVVLQGLAQKSNRFSTQRCKKSTTACFCYVNDVLMANKFVRSAISSDLCRTNHRRHGTNQLVFHTDFCNTLHSFPSMAHAAGQAKRNLGAYRPGYLTGLGNLRITYWQQISHPKL